MDNQHRKINGYRELNEDEIVLMNAIKNLGPILQEVIKAVERSIEADNVNHGSPDAEAYRWVSIGKTHLQQGLMALTRAVARPEFF